MGQKDIATAKYMQRSTIIADLFNFYLHDGFQAISPDSIHEMDIHEIGNPQEAAEEAPQLTQKFRDVIRSVTAMTDQNLTYLLLGIENQSYIHYAMPVKNMVYDSLQYAKQVEKANDSHQASGGYHKRSGNEFLSGFMKSDHLIPVLTLALYFSAEEWDGPLSIHEMFSDLDEKLLSFIPDYRINLLAPVMIRDEDFAKFQTSLRQVLKFIKYSKDKNKLREILQKDPGFQKLGRDEVDVLNVCTGAKLQMKEDEEVMDVCYAIQGMMQDAREEGKAEEIISIYREEGYSDQFILEKLQLKLSLAMDKAMEFLQKYGKQTI